MVQGAMARDAAISQMLCGDVQGFSLHAAVRCGADDRQALEQLCRYITRPALANERVQCNAAGQVVLKLKTAWRDGTTHIVMSPLEFMQRLAALVPRPRLHLIRFHGVLAPDAELRALVVPAGPAEEAGVSEPAATEPELRTPPASPHQLGPAAWGACSRSTSNTARTVAAGSRSSPPSWRRRSSSGSSTTSVCRPGRRRGHRRASRCSARRDFGSTPNHAAQRLGPRGRAAPVASRDRSSWPDRQG